MSKEIKDVSASPDIEKHGYDGVSNTGADVRKGSITGKFRQSLSVQHIQEDSIEGQVFSMTDVDPVLDAKMRIVNDVGRPLSPLPDRD